MVWQPNKPFSGYNTGQLIGEILSTSDARRNKKKRARNIALGIMTLVGGGDAKLRADNNAALKSFDDSKTAEIAKSSKMYDDAVALQTVQDSIDKYGGGLDGALVHYDPEAELAFNVKHKDILDIYEGAEATEAAVAAKSAWKKSFIQDNLYNRHVDLYNLADAGVVSSITKEEYNKPFQDYYSAKINQANDPANLSVVHKPIRKSFEILGLETKGDRLQEKVLEEEIDWRDRHDKIDNYRRFYSGKSYDIPETYLKGSAQNLNMNKDEFFDAWYSDDKLNDDYAEVAYEGFKKAGGRLLDYEAQSIAYLAEKDSLDSKRKIEQAHNKVALDPNWATMDNEEKQLRRRMASMDALGLDASKTKLQLDTRIAVNELIQSKAEGFILPEDDPKTKEIDEEREAKKLLHTETWAKARRYALLKLTGGIDYDKERTDFITRSSALLYNDMLEEEPEIMSIIRNIKIPTGISPSSKKFGQEHVTKQVELLYPGDKNKVRRQSILAQMNKANYNLMGTGGKVGPDEALPKLIEDTDAYNIILKAQKQYFQHIEHQNLVAHSFLFIEQLKASPVYKPF